MGAKGNVLGGLLSFDASLYYIDWKDIQLGEATPAPQSFPFIGNAGAAKSQCAEISAEARPVAGLRVNAWVAFSDAVLTDALPPTAVNVAASGSPLPLSSRFSSNVSLDQEFPLAAGLAGYGGISMSYVGQRWGVYSATAQRQELGAYAKTDARAGIKYDLWKINIYGNNLTNRLGALNGGEGNLGYPPNAFAYIQPRTIGLSVSRSF